MSAMAKVKFGDVVKEVKNKVDRNNNPYEFYVAGDHMDTDSLSIPRRGSFLTDDVGPAFIREFKKGQVLYGSRRTYLRKVAVADFDGVTANTTFVLETKDENVLRQRLLPFIMYTEGFTEWSIKKSKGSTNPYVLFKDLADYEFDLPSIKEQDKLADVLWSINDTLQAYQNLLTQTDALVQAQFVEMFGDPIAVEEDSSLPELGKACLLKAGKFVKADDIKESPSDNMYPCYGGNGLRGYVANYNHEGEYPLVGRQGALCGNVQYASGKFYATEHAIVVTPKQEMDRYWLFHLLTLLDLNRYSSGAAQPGLAVNKLEAIRIYIPSVEKQNKFSTMAKQADRSKSALQNTITSLQATRRCILETALGNRGKE